MVESEIQKLFENIKAVNAMELDITDHCNLHCIMCSRGCDIVGEEYNKQRGALTIDDVERFIKETKELNHHWDIIRIIGGEPTIHPQIYAITEILYRYGIESNTPIRIHTNGATQKTGDLVEELMKVFPGVTCDDTKKILGNSYQSHFISLYIKPTDIGIKDLTDTGNCWVLKQCGFGLASSGYGICCNIHTFMRHKGKKSNIQTLKDLFNYNYFKEQLLEYCPTCGLQIRQPSTAVSKYWYDFFKESNPEYWEERCEGHLIK